MKKMVSFMVTMIAVVMFIAVSYADYNYDLYCKLRDYIESTGLDIYFNGKVNEDGIYMDYGYMPLSEMSQHYESNVDVSMINVDMDEWFIDWYKPLLEKEFPEYGKIEVDFWLYDEYDGMNIYRLVVKAENDLVNHIDGEQKEIMMLVVFD